MDLTDPRPRRVRRLLQCPDRNHHHLFQRVDSGEYLRAHAARELAGAAADQFLAGATATIGRRDHPTDPDAGLARPCLIKVQTPVGKSVALSGNLEAWWHVGAWTFDPNGTVHGGRSMLAGAPAERP